MAEDSKKGIGISLGILLAVLTVLVILQFDATHGLDPHYVAIFTGLGVADCLGLVIFLLWGAIKHNDEETYAPRIYDDNEDRPLSQYFLVKILAALLLIFFFAGAEIATQHSVLPIINPYNAGQLITSKEQFSTVGNTVINGLRTGVYAGTFEDVAGYILTTTFSLFFLWLFKRIDEDSLSNKILVALSIVLGSFLWSIIFATAHMAAYGINTQAYIAVFAYGFSSQIINGFIGAPVSIFAHFLHNFLAIWFFGVGLSIGGVPLLNGTKTAGAIFFPGVSFKWRNSMKKTTQVIALLAILAIFLTGCASNKFDVASNNPNCGGDYKIAPGPIQCHADSDCVNQLIPAGSQMDSGTSLRCNNNICEFKISQCTGDVTP